MEQVLAAPPDSALAREWVAAGFRHVPLRTPADRSIRRPGGGLSPARAVREVGRLASGAWRIAGLARRTGATVLHANGHWTHLEVAAASRLARRPAVLHLHEQSQRDAIGALRGLAVSATAASVAVSDAVVGSLPASSHEKVHVVRSGVDTDRFAPATASGLATTEGHTTKAADPLVLVAARLVPAKGIDHVIRAVAGLPDELGQTRLAIAGTAPVTPFLATAGLVPHSSRSGEPDYAATLHELGRRLLGERVRFLGGRDDLPDLLRAADALVLASEVEGLGLCVLEAQASGTPAVAYPAGGVAELIEHDVTGLLAEQGDVADLTRQLTRLLLDRALAERLAGAARDRVLKEGTIAQQADKHVDILRAVVGLTR
jgi:glycosyltransferase involved in cell wall biosynthesis